jgi:hypothetical protein
MLSHKIEREMEYSAKTTLPLNSIGIIHSLPVFRIVLHFGIIFTHIYLFAISEKVKRAYISLTSIRFWRFMPKGEKELSPKQKDRTTTNFKNLVFQFVFKVVFSNWYLIVDRFFKLVYPLQN